MKNAVIQVENLTKRFGDFTAVDNISFEVEKGEIFGFLGANGAGKTTAMRMLCGLSNPTSGGGTVAGFDISQQSEEVKKHIGYMSQKFALYEDLKVWENMRLYAGIYGVPRKKISEIIDKMLVSLDFDSEKKYTCKRVASRLETEIGVFRLHYPLPRNCIFGRTDGRR